MQGLNTYPEELRSRLLQGGAVKHFADLFKQPQVRILAVQAVATLANYGVYISILVIRS